MLGALQMGGQAGAFVAAILVGAGLALAVVAAIMRVRTKQRTLAQILDDTMGTAQVPVEVVSESPEHGELSALTVRIAGIFGRIDTSGALEQRLERAAIPLRAGEYLVISAAIALMLAVVVGVMSRSPIGSVIAIFLVAAVAWYLPSRRAAKRIKQMQEQLPDALALMAASVEGGQTFQRSIDMYRRDARPPLSDRAGPGDGRGGGGVRPGRRAREHGRALRGRGPQVGRRGGADPAVDRWPPGAHPAHAGRLHADAPGGAPGGADAVGRRAHVGLRALRHPALPGVALEMKDPGYLQPMLHGAGLDRAHRDGGAHGRSGS